MTGGWTFRTAGRRARAAIAAAWVVANAFFAPAEAQARFDRQERALPGALRAMGIVDVDGDERADLFFTALDGPRRLAGFFAGVTSGGFAEKPAHVLELKPDVVLVGLGDVDAAPGRELLLFTAASVFAYRWKAPTERERYRRLFREPGFFSFADPASAPLWPHVRDVDGDGLDDVCVAVASGHAIRYQARSATEGSTFERREGIGAWVDEATGDPMRGQRRMRLSVSLGGDDAGARAPSDLVPVGGYMVESARRMSAPVLADEDGDGRLDLLLLEGNQIKVWRQRAKGGFHSAPDVREDVAKLMAKTPRWARSGNIRHVDLDGDEKLDFLVRQEVSDRLRTRLLLFTGGTGGLARPACILVLQGLTATPRFTDVNGDGRLDLLVPTYRLDLLKKAKQAAVRSLDVTLHVFLNRGTAGIFGRRPDYSHDESLRTDNLAVSGIEPMIYIDGDFNRDGRADLLVLDEDSRLKVRLATETAGGLFSRGGKFAFHGRPAIDLAIDVPHRLRVRDIDGDGQSEIVMAYGRRIVIGGWNMIRGRGR